MKYIVYLDPGKGIKSEVQRLRGQVNGAAFSHPSLETHCTVAIWRTDPQYESRMLSALEDIWCPPVKSSVTGVDLFDGGALVAKLNKTASFDHLHFAVLDALMVAPKDPIEEDSSLPERAQALHRLYGSPYFGDNYSPHVTIARVDPSVIDLDGLQIPERELIGHEIRFAKKENDVWKPIARFSMDGDSYQY